MKTMSIKIKSVIIALIACVLGAAFAAILSVYEAKADTSLEGYDDVFELIDKSYGAEEKFVFSATANFERGNAAGLVFGATEGQSYWVFNVDRAANAVKLMYFDYSSGEKKVHVLKEEFYVGTDLMNDGEREYVQSRTANIDKVYFKVIVAPTDDGVFAELYADGIRRFCYVNGSEEAEKLDLNALTVGGGDEDSEEVTLSYGGGRLGYNCFNAKVRFTDEEIGETDYAAYSEIYRNQYHFSQYAHWNNDPNGLVYYNGYYHLYFQHNPYGNTWDAMHWGHARSKDLVHWELLPIALVPDRDLSVDGNTDYGIGAMWSGSARVYHKGDSDKIDNEYKWFGEAEDKTKGDALGLIGFYTRFDNGGNRHQIVMYSTDGGLSWNKRDNIPSTVSKQLDGSNVNGGSWRDPKVFDISGITGISDGYKWGMVLSNMEGNTMYFLKSRNLIDWEHAGCYKVYRPECPDLVTLNDGDKTRTVITFTSRYYVVCDLSYEDGQIVMKDGRNKITSLMQGDPLLKKMDYGVDSYAAQTFYIDDDSDSAYAGKCVSMSWFSGVPNAEESIESGVLQTARKVWNGGGMTIPVVYGLDGGTLTTTPITATDPEFDKLKTSIVEIGNSPISDGLLSDVKSRTAEITAKLSNPSRGGVSFKVNMSADGKAYTEIGWNRTEGYFVDRTHTDDGGINFPLPNYAVRYASGMGKDNTALDFYILVDRNNVEVYCDGFTVPFYILTFASPFSEYMSFTSESDLTVVELKVNALSNVWREANSGSVIYVSETNVELDMSLSAEKEITVAADGEITYEITSGASVAELTPTAVGFTVKAISYGNAVIAVKCCELTKTVNVTVHSGMANTDMTFKPSGVISGTWLVSGNTIIGEQLGGDGFLLAEESGADFIYSATFDLGTGAAAALVFRATENDGKLDSYIIANYDNNGKIVKLWSQNREIARAEYTPSDIHDMSLTAFVEGDRVRISVDGREVINVVLSGDEPTNGRFGLNACATRATFKSVLTVLREYEYTEGLLLIGAGDNTRIDRIVNKTFANTEVPKGFYNLIGGKINIASAYMSVLPQEGVYVLAITGDKISFEVTVDVKALPEIYVSSVTVAPGVAATVFIGKRNTEYLLVNGNAIPSRAYEIKNYTLTIASDYLPKGDNTVVLSDGTLFLVSVWDNNKETLSVYIPPVPLDFTAVSVGLGVTVGIILLLLVAFIVLTVLDRKGKITLKKPFSDRTAAVRRRNFGLIVGACIVGPIALIFAVCAATAPMGNGGFIAATVLTVVFGYPYVAQIPWKGKIYNATFSPVKTSGTPKDIFDVDKDCNKFKLVLRYIGAAFKMLWLGVKILVCAAIALIRAPFMFADQTKAVTYGEFGFSNKADSIEREQSEESAGEQACEEV